MEHRCDYCQQKSAKSLTILFEVALRNINMGTTINHPKEQSQVQTIIYWHFQSIKPSKYAQNYLKTLYHETVPKSYNYLGQKHFSLGKVKCFTKIECWLSSFLFFCSNRKIYKRRVKEISLDSKEKDKFTIEKFSKIRVLEERK